MQFERNLYAEGLHILRRTFPYAAVVVFGELAVAVLMQVNDFGEDVTLTDFLIWTGYTIVSTLIWAILAFAAHAELLLPPNRDTGEDYQRMFGFGLRSLCLLVLMTIPTLAMLLLVWFARIQNLIGEEVFVVVFVSYTAAVVLIILAVLAFLGTILPAYVAGKGRGVRPALSRGARQFLYIAGRLIVGPGVVTIILFAVAIFPVFIFESPEDQTPVSDLFEGSYWMAEIISNAIQTYATVLTAVILSRAFLRDQALEEIADSSA